MANGNFIVQNGLQVGPLTIDAATGSISTSGTVSISGGMATSTISKNDSSITINDTGTGSTVVIAIDGTTEHTVDANGVNLASGDGYSIAGTSVLNATTLGSGVVNSSLTSVGTLTSLSTGAITTTGTLALNAAGGLTTNQTTFPLVNTTATTVNFAGAATTLAIGASSGTATLNNATLTLPNATTVNVNGANPTLATSSTGTVTLFNTNATTVNAFGAATTIGIGNASGTTTIAGISKHTGNLVAGSGTASSSTTTGALVVVGGAGVSGAVNIGGATKVTDSTASTSTSSGALVVSGGLGVGGQAYFGGDIHTSGNLYVANLVSVGTTITEVTSPLLYLESNVVYPYNYDIGSFSHFIGGPANVYAHTGMIRSSANGYWGFFSNVKQEPSVGGTVNWADAGIVWDKIKSGDHIIANTTASSSTTTGALQVAGGAGIAGAAYIGGVARVTDATASSSTSTGALVVTGGAGIGGALYSASLNTGSGAITTTGTVSATTLTGTLSTASQTNITGVGTITTGTWNAGAVTSSGAVTGTTHVSTVATGTAPLTVSSTTLVSNLNADLWDGNHFSSYLNQAVLTSSAPTFAGLTTTAAILPNTNGTLNLGGASNYFATVYGKATTAQYADLAENYQGDKNYTPGTVVMFGGSAEVTLAAADTTAVAGVVSTNPAHLMNGALTGPNVVPVAFTGRVPCQVIGPVKKGDIMVSAGFGYAKVNNTPQVGTIIGKALQDYSVAGKGVIEVVVGRF